MFVQLRDETCKRVFHTLVIVNLNANEFGDWIISVFDVLAYQEHVNPLSTYASPYFLFCYVLSSCKRTKKLVEVLLVCKVNAS